MNPFYHQAHFLTSAATLPQSPTDEGIEVAFAGRSNAGKSSALNVLCNQRNLARTSKTPGRTQLLNFFELDEGRRLVDLPGYGFAQVPEAMKRRWQAELARYLQERRSLRGVVLLMDIRHPLKEFDCQMLDWAAHIALPTHILLTKSDKFKRGAAMQALRDVRDAVRSYGPGVSLQLFSALDKTGVDEAHAQLDRWFGLGTAEAVPN